jgi:hypothetical protein
MLIAQQFFKDTFFVRLVRKYFRLLFEPICKFNLRSLKFLPFYVLQSRFIKSDTEHMHKELQRLLIRGLQFYTFLGNFNRNQTENDR